MEITTEQLWSKVLAAAKATLGEQGCETWFHPIKAKEISQGTLILEVPNEFFQNWIKDHYLELINQAVKTAAPGQELAVEFTLAKQELPSESEVQEKPKSRRWFFQKPARESAQPDKPQLKLNPRLTFDTFVVGPSNRFAHAASLAVAESPARSYNPLFIYGGVGLGKTHLMQAIGSYILEHNPQLKVTYISSEKFTNQLISAIQNRTTKEFRERYRHEDLLLIDDIHFIAGKEATQEEFFHTFNTLYDAHKQIILSSDRPPKDIPTLEERLVSRFEWGLVTDIQPPDLETRIAILKKKTEQHNINSIPDDVLFFIGDKIKINIRELEGALIRVVAYSSLTNQAITLQLAQSVLKDMILEDKKVSVDSVQKKVAAHFDLRISDLKAKKRTRAVVYPRQIAMFLSRNLTDCSLPEIGEYFGGRDHTTVLYAYDKIQKDIQRDQKLKGLVEKLALDIKVG
ncbi:chromosomal replication initiator protein DnaA [Candidatus Omnitrophota bacterium]